MGLGAYVDQGLNGPPGEQLDQLVQRTIAMAKGKEGSRAHDLIMRKKWDRWQTSSRSFRPRGVDRRFAPERL